MAQLTFPVDENLRRIVEHAASNTPRPNFAQLADPALRRPEAEGKCLMQMREEDVDPAKLPLSLWLVKDAGVYLMSPGTPGLLAEDPAAPHRHLVAYARGCHPGQHGQQVMEDEAGGDDFVEALNLGFFQSGLQAGATAFVVEVTATHWALSYTQA